MSDIKEAVGLIIQAGRDLGSREIKTIKAPSGDTLAFLPGSDKLMTLPERRERPLALVAEPTFDQWQGFVEYVNRFKGSNSLIFAEAMGVDSEGDPTGRFSMKAELDYHGPGENGQSFREHKAWLRFAHSIEWVRWTKIDREVLSQQEFAEFIEENSRDIITPDPLTVLECAQEFEEVRSVKILSKKRLENGLTAVSYQQEIGGNTDSRQAKIPNRLELWLRPFVGFPPVKVPARLRYNVDRDGVLTFTVVLDRLSEVLEPAFEQIAADVKVAVELPMLVGKP